MAHITAFWEQCKLWRTAGSAALLARWLVHKSYGAVTSCLMLQRCCCVALQLCRVHITLVRVVRLTELESNTACANLVAILH